MRSWASAGGRLMAEEGTRRASDHKHKEGGGGGSRASEAKRARDWSATAGSFMATRGNVLPHTLTPKAVPIWPVRRAQSWLIRWAQRQRVNHQVQKA